VASFDDVTFWVGAGANRAAVVIDFDGDDGGDQSLAWGYRWSGGAFGIDMLRAVVVADPRLYAKLGTFSYGTSVFGLGYDLDDDGQFGVADETTFDENGVATAAYKDGNAATDGGDLYREGWEDGTWSYGVAASDPWTNGWSYAALGASLQPLADGAWNSWAFTTVPLNTSAFAINAIAATPSADFNLDGAVDGADLIAWQRGLGRPAATRASGDSNHDGAVDAADLAAWRAQASAFVAASAVATAVPEPSTILLVLCASAAAKAQIRRSGSRSAANPTEFHVEASVSTRVGLPADRQPDLSYSIVNSELGATHEENSVRRSARRCCAGRCRCFRRELGDRRRSVGRPRGPLHARRGRGFGLRLGYAVHGRCVRARRTDARRQPRQLSRRRHPAAGAVSLE
jgi:hypothetical protein